MSRHLWAEWVESKEVRHLLWQAKEQLKVAWEYDQERPKMYPMNTYVALAEISNRLTNPAAACPPIRLALHKPRIPRTLWELISEEIVKAVWEDNHSGSFEQAIAQANPTDYTELRKSQKVFKGIIRAIETAYDLDYVSWQLLPRPKVNILRRRLNEIAKAAGIEDQKEVGFAEFLDDLCPCGLKNHREAVRKLASRSSRMRRPKSRTANYR